MAPPTLLTPELQAEICERLRGGASIRSVVVAVGVTRQTFFNWRKRDDEPYASFNAACDQAMAEAEVALIEKVRRGEPGWQGAAWILERTRRAEYGRMSTVEHTGGLTIESVLAAPNAVTDTDLLELDADEVVGELEA